MRLAGQSMGMIPEIARLFRRDNFSAAERFTYIGQGSPGAKAGGIARALPLLKKLNSRFKPLIQIDVPLLTVITTDHFDSFLDRNGLQGLVISGLSDDELENAFQRAVFPPDLEDDLKAFLAIVNAPLAVRSSSMLEDDVNVPFAGIYDTSMIPNNQVDFQIRLESLERAIKHVYASTFYQKARKYREVADCLAEEKMAVIVQEVIGTKFGRRFYPHISGIAKSYNFYPTGLSRPKDGLIGLALGLGKIIVDDGRAWYYSPAYPHANPPYKSIRDLLTLSQKDFWAIDMRQELTGNEPAKADYLTKFPLQDAERDGTLAIAGSTYIAADDKIIPGISESGPRLLDFARILKTDIIPLNDLIKSLLSGCEDILGTMANIEFAATIPHNIPASMHVGFLQMRPMTLSDTIVELAVDELTGNNVILASESCLGNGTIDSIGDIVYVPHERFNVAHTAEIAVEIEKINNSLTASGLPYILMGFGRWGSSDPSAGIPVNFCQLSGAKVIVEMSLPSIDFFASQGSHFFHNITSHKVLYFSIGYSDKYRVDWRWLNSQTAVQELKFIRHIRPQEPLKVKVDGKTGRGVVIRRNN
jgi:hypothetical protein